MVSAPTAAQQPEDSDAAVVRIVARKGADGRVEFALQQRHDDTWGQRQLPRSRFFPTTAPVDRWLTSSPLNLDAAVVRIVARKGADGRVEFALQQRHDDTWGQRQLPRSRFFPTTAPVDRWLTSSPLNLDDRPATTPTTKRYTAITVGFDLVCALDSDGAITCWGDDGSEVTDAPTGHGYTAITTGGGRNLLPAPIEGLEGYSHSCALDRDGAITCWGDTATWCEQDEGRVTCSGSETSAGTNAPTGRGYTAIATGPYHSCALDSNGAITCWGDDHSVVTDAPTGGGYTAIATGTAYHVCALDRDGTITCWGVLKVPLAG
ncbi:MAG: RCC1 domain-containing protein [bacterium]|nr:RCC1 domain-containing protein [bacterium]